jgi:hypothetical protein
MWSRALVVAVTAVTALAVGGCGDVAPTRISADPAVTATAIGPSQVWRSVGYGWIIALTGTGDSTVERTYETTAMSCLPEAPLDRTGSPTTDGSLSFGPNGLPTMTIHPGSAGLSGPATLNLSGSAAAVDLQPLPGLPGGCTAAVPDDPVHNFDVFWQTFADNYNSFTRKNIDWAAARARYRPMVDDDTTPKKLFRIFKDMVTPLGDAHVSLEGPKDDSFAPKRPGTRDEDDVSRGQAVKAVNHYLTHDLGVSDIEDFADDRISYADLPDGRGYLRLTSFEGYGGAKTPFVTSSAVLRQVLNRVFTPERVSRLRGLVIDVRFNTGGDDALGLQLAGQLTNTPYVAYRKQPRTDPADPAVHGRLQTVMVTPTPDAVHYTGPVTLLTSDLTVSAGETFVEAMLGRTPAPLRIGATTQGVLSDDMTRTLPNGWTFTLGNEDYYDAAGHDYEGAGIPPNLTVPVFTSDELHDERDSALAAALAPPQ